MLESGSHNSKCWVRLFVQVSAVIGEIIRAQTAEIQKISGTELEDEDLPATLPTHPPL